MRSCDAMLYHILIVVLLTTASWDSLAAQEVVPVQPGTRVRVHAPSLKEQLPHPGLWSRIWGDPYSMADPRKGRAVATVLSSNSDSLTIQMVKGDFRTALSWNDIEKLEKDSGRGERAATVGALVGTTAGVALGLFTGEDCNRPARDMFSDPCMSRTTGALLFGLSGLIGGAAVGILMVEEWIPVPLPAQVEVKPEPGSGLRVSAFRRF
jgi:hypothetical protein